MLLSSGIFMIRNDYRHRRLDNYGKKIDLDAFRTFYIMPRAICNKTSNGIYIDNGCSLDNTIYIFGNDLKKIDNECNNCEYAENCDGQICFWSMV